MTEFDPQNPLEECLLRARKGEISVPDVVEVLVESNLAFPSGQAVEEDGSGFQPLLVEEPGPELVVAFSDKSRAKVYADVAPYCLEMNTIEFFKRMQHGQGVIINPGNEVGLTLPPMGIRNIMRDFG